MYLQYHDHGWDSYSPDGIQSQYGYALSHQEANYFGKEEKGLTDNEVILEVCRMQGRVSHVYLVA